MCGHSSCEGHWFGMSDSSLGDVFGSDVLWGTRSHGLLKKKPCVSCVSVTVSWYLPERAWDCLFAADHLFKVITNHLVNIHCRIFTNVSISGNLSPPPVPPLFLVNQTFYFLFWLPEYSLMISLSTPPPSSKRLWPKKVFLGTWDTIFLNLEIWAKSNSQDLRSEGQQKECGVEPRWPGFQSQLSGRSSVLPDKLLKLSDIQFHFEIGEVILYHKFMGKMKGVNDACDLSPLNLLGLTKCQFFFLLDMPPPHLFSISLRWKSQIRTKGESLKLPIGLV